MMHLDVTGAPTQGRVGNNLHLGHIPGVGRIVHLGRTPVGITVILATLILLHAPAAE